MKSNVKVNIIQLYELLSQEERNQNVVQQPEMIVFVKTKNHNEAKHKVEYKTVP